MHSLWKSLVIGLLFGLGLVGLLAKNASAQTEVGVISGTPLKIQAFPDGSLQVWHNRYTKGATFGTAGSGFFIALNTNTYGPFHVDMELVNQTATQGTGTKANPFRSTLRQRFSKDNASLEVTQTVLYINGSQSFQLEWLITNTGSANTCFKAYHAADLYFANDDRGAGYYNASTGSVGGYNAAKDWFMVFTPVNPASHYEEAGYRTIWTRLQTEDDLNDTIDSDYIDNGAALQWNLCLVGGQSKTISDVWSFGTSEGAIVAAAQEVTGSSTYGPLGLSASEFRPVAPGSPTLTTTIPTPLDISLAPEVVGANLLWAALATILFTIASEIFNRLLADYEAFFQRVVKPLKQISEWNKKAGLAERLGRPIWYERLKLVLIILLYGLTFSFLDNTWKPFSLNGIWLFIAMAIAFGVVGLADDITEWNTARRWNLPTWISIRPGNLLLAFLSMIFSRTLVLTPGVMFGTPEAFEIEEEALNSQRRNRLLLLALGVLLAIMLGSWLPTILSALALRAGTPQPNPLQVVLLAVVAGLQSLLLLIFAVTVQNIFLHMLALPDTIGEMIKRRNRIVWFIALLLASYIYLQTLLNPTGDLARSLQTSNLRAFMGTIGLFLLFVIIVRGLLKRVKPIEASKPTPPPGVEGFALPQANGVGDVEYQPGVLQVQVSDIKQPSESQAPQFPPVEPPPAASETAQNSEGTVPPMIPPVG
jgi:hypothetical protein